MWSRRFDYLGLMILVVVGILFYHHYLLMLLLVLLLGAPVISYVMTRRSLDKFHIHIASDKTSVGKNIPVDVSFGIENNSIIPVEEVEMEVKIRNAYYENDETYQLVAAAIPKKTRQTRLSICGIYCGRMIIEVDSVTIYDMLRLFKFRRTVSKSVEIFIMPSKNETYEDVSLSTKGVSEDEELQLAKGDDVSQISQIRSYIPGDRLQNIHWKLSAKSEELQVKEYSLPYSEDVTLLLELFVDKEMPEVFDEMIETIYSLSYDFIHRGRKFSVMWRNEESYELIEKEVYGEDDLQSVLYELFFVKPQTKRGMTYELYTSLYSEKRGTILYLSDSAEAMKTGAKMNIDSEKVVLTCLD